MYGVIYGIICIESCFRNDNKKLRNTTVQLRGQLDRAQRRLKELEDQAVQHGQLQGKMRERLKQMDDHAQHGTSQVCYWVL